MAEEKQGSGVKQEENVENFTGSPSADEEKDTRTDLHDWLFRRTKRSHKWKQTYFSLNVSMKKLLYGNDEKKLKKEIFLESALITEDEENDRPYTFKIRPKNVKRTYYISAKDEETYQKWLQAVCMLKISGKTAGDNSEACCVQ